MFKKLFNFLAPVSEKDNMAKIVEAEGKFYLVDRRNIAIEGTSSYSRRRDAVRGATRRGLVIA